MTPPPPPPRKRASLAVQLAAASAFAVVGLLLSIPGLLDLIHPWDSEPRPVAAGEVLDAARGRWATVRGVPDPETLVTWDYLFLSRDLDTVAFQFSETGGSLVVVVPASHHPLISELAEWLQDEEFEIEASDALLDYVTQPQDYTGVLTRPAGGFRLHDEGTVVVDGEEIPIDGYGSFCDTLGIVCDDGYRVLAVGETPHDSLGSLGFVLFVWALGFGVAGAAAFSTIRRHRARKAGASP